MNIRLVVVALLSGVAPAAFAQQKSELPAGVTKAMVAKGEELYQGLGLCAACHGPDAKGAAGPDLTDSVWAHGKGTYQDIVALIIAGAPEGGTAGAIMPPRGGSALSDEELKLVAAYVWTLSHQPKKP